MHKVTDRQGNIQEENSIQDRLLEQLYQHAAGRILLRPLISPVFSRLGGCFLDSSISRFLISPFIRANAIDMSDYEQTEYRSYNDFFKRKIRPEARCIQTTPEVFVSPCDSRMSVYPIDGRSDFYIKHTHYTAESLLKNRKLAEKYAGGYIWIFRLCVDDYHRYIYVDGGKTSRNIRIPGIYHTVNPVANDRYPIYKENTREYCLLRSENFGTVLQMEVGAMLVGKIENRPGQRMVQRGEEKGNFAFGGSTVILMTQRGRVIPDPDILEYSARGIETKVKLGERVGCKK